MPALTILVALLGACTTQSIVIEIPDQGSAQHGRRSARSAARPVAGSRGMQTRRVSVHAGSPIVDVAKEYLGVPYRYGGESPKEGFDCSGFTGYVYREAGLGDLARSADGQFDSLHPVSPPKPGDLVFFKIKGNRISHVGIYAGDLKFIHAPRTGKSVSYADLRNDYWKKRYAGARSISAN